MNSATEGAGAPGESSSPTVAVVGLGRMGLPIAGRLQAAGYEVFAHDQADPAVVRARGLGVTCVDTLAEVAARAELALVVVSTDAAVLEVCRLLLAEDVAPGTVVVCSSVEPSTMETVDGWAARRPDRPRLLEAAMVRGEPAAADGTLLLYCGGARSDVERLTPLLRVLASDIVHVGGLGAGQLVKMLNNFLLWSNIVATTEAMRLGLHLDLAPDVVLDALRLGSGTSYVLDTWSRPRPMPDAEEGMDRVLGWSEHLGIKGVHAEHVSRLIREIKAEKLAWLDGAGVDESMDAFVRASVPRPDTGGSK